MLHVPGHVKIFLYLEKVDMRKSFDGLSAIVEHVLQKDPLSGHLFVFRNRRGDRLKILYWSGDGYTIWYRRLEAGTFRFPVVSDEQQIVTVSATDLAMLLDGVDLASVRRGKRFRRSA